VIKERGYRDWSEWQLGRVEWGQYSHVNSPASRIFISASIYTALKTLRIRQHPRKVSSASFKSLSSRSGRSSRTGFGWGTASRLIAEAVLTDSDSALAEEGYKSTRFVDDFRIFVRPDQAPYSILAFFAAQAANDAQLVEQDGRLGWHERKHTVSAAVIPHSAGVRTLWERLNQAVDNFPTFGSCSATRRRGWCFDSCCVPFWLH
jgi:hypothetical protein